MIEKDETYIQPQTGWKMNETGREMNETRKKMLEDRNETVCQTK